MLNIKMLQKEISYEIRIEFDAGIILDIPGKKKTKMKLESY